MSGPLPSGRYIITSKIDNRPIGGSDNNPWGSRVVILPGGAPAPEWVLTATDSGRYTISINGAGTVINDSALFADRDAPPEQWVITPSYAQGPGVYIIEAGNRESGWAVKNPEPYGQLNVNPLIATPSIPPEHPPFELFEIRRME